MEAVPWRLDPPEMISDEVLLDSGRTFQQVINPYYYQDALRDGIVQEVLFPCMINHWFRNTREQDWHWRGPGRHITVASLKDSWLMAIAITALELAA